MGTLSKWLRITVYGSLMSLILTSCNPDHLASSSVATPSFTIQSGERLMHKTKTSQSVRVTPSDTSEYPIHPDHLTNELMKGNYEQIYSQTSQAFKQEVSWDTFLKVISSFSDGAQGYQSISELKQDHTIRKVWIDEQQRRGIVAVFADQLPDYPDHTILGLRVNDLEKYPATDHIQTQTIFSPPVQQNWQVVWGGSNTLVNYHYEYPNQRYAYDLIVTQNGSSYRGNPKKNKSYFAFGRPVTAPADGKIVKVVNNIADNEPVGSTNEQQPAGNYVIIQHADREYSMLAHFRQHSIDVQVGDTVKRGQVLGQCGNSGNSSEPHIHFQVMDQANWAASTSLPVQFANHFSPIQGETMHPSL